MATIRVVRKHGLTQAKAKLAAEKMAKDLHRRFDLVCTWDDDYCRFERSGLNGNMRVDKEEITLDVKLGFLLSAVAPSIERAIHEELDELVGEPGAKAPKAAPKASPKAAAKPSSKRKG
ncbi:MAG: polyhydroxyalkanoic acid system family protein [Burkholderiales bacterium]|nr:polyhydroxyalkanoic acid system family protein [Burkholderiales bacterium]MCE7878250.1 polyhydroxyalkanoic acid system protein [Betaproteobacteria bacterium PRO3]